MGLEDLIVSELFCPCELSKRFVDTGCKGRMLQPSYDIQIFRNRRTDRRSRPGFAQVSRLKMDELAAAEMAGPMQREQHALNLVQPDIVARESRYVVGKQF